MLVEMEFCDLLFEVGKRGERITFNDRKYSQVMKGWRKELGPHCGRRTHSPILRETKVFHNKHHNTILTKD